MRRIDLHTHTFLSDGELVPVELARRAEHLEYEAIGITDHVGPSNIDYVSAQIAEASEELDSSMEIKIVPGVELTHIPPSEIPRFAKRARKNGADLVVMHGETIVEPVPEGTNLAALKCDDVDILGHPGMISMEEAELAEETGTYLELTSRKGHCLTNGRVASMAVEAGAKLIVNTDTHSPRDMITIEEAKEVAMGSGLEKEMLPEVLEENPRAILEDLK